VSHERGVGKHSSPMNGNHRGPRFLLSAGERPENRRSGRAVESSGGFARGMDGSQMREEKLVLHEGVLPVCCCGVTAMHTHSKTHIGMTLGEHQHCSRVGLLIIGRCGVIRCCGRDEPERNVNLGTTTGRGGGGLLSNFTTQKVLEKCKEASWDSARVKHVLSTNMSFELKRPCGIVVQLLKFGGGQVHWRPKARLPHGHINDTFVADRRASVGAHHMSLLQGFGMLSTRRGMLAGCTAQPPSESLQQQRARKCRRPGLGMPGGIHWRAA